MEPSAELAAILAEQIPPTGPGIAAGIYRDGALVQSACAGVSTVEFGVPITIRTRFDIASVSKQFTAAALLTLCEDGKVSLDDDIREYLPELRLEVPVTLDQCLRHTAGLPDWYSLVDLAGLPVSSSERQLVALIAGLRRVNFTPGTRYRYSNTGYLLVAAVIRRVTGQSLTDYAAARILGPLGMADSLYREDIRAVLPGLAYGYSDQDGDPRRADAEETAVGDGGLVTSVTDLAPWFGFLSDGRVLGTGLRDALLEPTVLSDGTTLTYARGICHLTVGSRPAFGHSGAITGYRSFLLFLPADDLGIAVLSNQVRVPPSAIAESLAKHILNEPPHPPAPARQPLIPHPRKNTVTDTPIPHGYWEDTVTDTLIEISRGDQGRIVVTDRGRHEYAPGPDGTWVGQGEAHGMVLTFDNDRVLLAEENDPPLAFRRCEPPVEGFMPPAAVYFSEELGVLATIDAGGCFRCGLLLKAKIEPGPAGTWRAGPLTLRADGPDLLVSHAPDIVRMRFTRQPDDTRPVGIPPGLS